MSGGGFIHCAECGSELPGGVPPGMCPHCALRQALDLGVEAGRPPTRSEYAARNSRPFGDYELLEEIARGGMGVVYKARQKSLDRIVAVKLLLPGPLASPDFIKRFRIEASAAAALQHPNIVAIHEVGVHEGEHYLAMDYVDGPNLAQFVKNEPLPPKRAAGYLKLIAEAIHHAHEKGVLHRDLKPSNVLIDSNDQPRVTDFGLAKRLGTDSQPSTDLTQLTLSGHVVGSPGYMPPEQAMGARGKLSRRSDVYSLGAMLYHLLTGRPPFGGGTVAETLRQVEVQEPVSPRLLNPVVPLDLETICLKCLEKEPDRRYHTAKGLGEELGRFLNDQSIHARPVGRTERMWRWCRRKPVMATLSAATSLLLLTVVIGSPIATYRIRHERKIAQGRLYAAQMKLVHAQWRAGKVGAAQELLRAQPPEFCGFDWRYFLHLCRASESPHEVLATNSSGFTAVDWSPDQHVIALGTGDGVVEVYDVPNRKLAKRWQAHSGPLGDLSFHPANGNWLVSVSGDDGLLKLWDVARQRVLLSTNGPKGLFAHLAFSPNGNLLAAGASDGVSLNIWEVTLPALIRKTNLNFNVPVEAAFAADNQTLALCNARTKGNRVAFYNVAHGRITSLPEVHSDIIYSAVFSADGSLLATGGADEQVVVWDVKTQSPVYTNQTGLVNVMSLAFAPDGKKLFAGGWDQNFLCWNLARGGEPIALRGHSAAIHALAAAMDGSSLVSASRDGTARLWDLRAKPTVVASPVRAGFDTLLSPDQARSTTLQTLYSVAVSPTQNTLAAGTATELILFDLAAHRELARTTWKALLDTEGSQFCTLAFSHDANTLAVGAGNGTLVFCDATTLTRTKQLSKPHRQRVAQIAFALEGAVLISSGAFGDGVAVSDTASGRILTNFPAIEGSFPLQPFDVSRNGRMLALGTPEQFVVVRDLGSGRVVARSRRKVRFLHAVTFSPDGTTVAYSDELGGVYLWDLTGQRPLRTLTGHLGPALDLAFSPDGRTLASASMDHTVKLWNPELDQEVATLEGHAGWIWCLAFAENGRTLVSGGRDGSLKAWRAVASEEIWRR